MSQFIPVTIGPLAYHLLLCSILGNPVTIVCKREEEKEEMTNMLMRTLELLLRVLSN